MAFNRSTISISTAIEEIGPGDLSRARNSLNRVFSNIWTNGTGANQADKFYADDVTIASGATTDIDLTSVEDEFGNALAAAEVAAIVLVAASGNTTNVTVGGSSADFAGLPGQTLAPGRKALHMDFSATGLGPVTDGSTDTIRLANASGAAATVSVVVVARSA